MDRNTTLHVIVITLFLSASTVSFAQSVCPDTTIGETTEDCPWGAVARELVKTAESGGSVQKKLEAELPTLMARFQADRDRSDWLKLWGYSINFDELAHGVIVNPEIVKAVATELGTSAPLVATDSHVVPAGVEHTYSYLFSLLKTSFGYKRLRWVHPTLDQGFGFSEPTLAPLPASGTLFGNATYFGGRIAFRGEHVKLAELHTHEETVPESLRSYDYSKLKISRLEEHVVVNSRLVVLRTDLVTFPNPTDDGNSTLLIYSVHDPKLDGSVLISMFPVTSSFVTMALDAKNLGARKPVITRYNGFVEGLTGHTLQGLRKVVTQ
ncbi:MAG: hypothetical protein P4M08_12475 [Oligoflexia bacterium]|nr:hypothetical protein [Oligoflexia bacterium]